MNESSLPATVFIVDDDAGIRHSLSFLLEAAHLQVECFASAEEFLEHSKMDQGGCLLLDMRMPGINGRQLQDELVRRGVTLPIIFMSAYADVRTGVEAIKQGALDFLAKPVDAALLMQRVHAALALDRARRQAGQARQSFEARLSTLTRREREVLALALAGLPNKTIARDLQASLRTIEGHRARIYLKAGISSLVELAAQAAAAGIPLAEVIARLGPES